jgi:hypothetical protein
MGNLANRLGRIEAALASEAKPEPVPNVGIAGYVNPHAPAADRLTQLLDAICGPDGDGVPQNSANTQPTRCRATRDRLDALLDEWEHERRNRTVALPESSQTGGNGGG